MESEENKSTADELEAPVDFRLEELRILAGDEFRVYIYKHVNGAYELQAKKGEIPDIDDVGREFGPGKYQVKVSYKRQTTKAKENPWTFNTVTFTLGQPYAVIHREFKKQQAEVNGSFEGQQQQAQPSSLERLREMIEIMSLMRGVMPQAAPAASPGDALRDITPLITAVIGRPAPEKDNTAALLLPKLLELATQKNDTAPQMAQMVEFLKLGMEMGGGANKEESGGLSGMLETLAPALLEKFMDRPGAAPGGSAKVINHEEIPARAARVLPAKSLSNPAIGKAAEELRNNPAKLQSVYNQVKAAKGQDFADGLLKQYNLTLPQSTEAKPTQEKKLVLNAAGRIKL